ncbi:hypothetical protein BGZ91_000976, partial [Linnemannia elongata]
LEAQPIADADSGIIVDDTQAVVNTSLDEDDRAPDQGIDQENLEAADQGGPTAQNNIDHPGTLMRSDNAIEEGDVDGWGDLDKANIYASGDGVPKDMKVAFEWILKSAEKGNLYAQKFVGNWYYSGLDVPQDYGKAKQWLINPANQGIASTQYTVGSILYREQGVPPNYAQAFQWFLKTANQGDDAAQREVGNMYHLGHGVDQDLEKAVEWLLKAAEQDLALAQERLGNIYLEGLGVDQDPEKTVSRSSKNGLVSYTTMATVFPRINPWGFSGVSGWLSKGLLGYSATLGRYTVMDLVRPRVI